ncbi:MAG: hypothetical protein IPP73_02805 [Chitinophagaceae bacterium]|nr:hypothetical protein [Chitinophagaceae bacterium]
MTKKIGYIFSLILTVLFFSCQQEIDPNTGGTGNTGSTGDFRAKIDGVQWVANKTTGASRMSGFINITGVGTDKKLITMTLTDSGVHHYILNDASFNVGAFQDSTLPNVVAFSSNASGDTAIAGGYVDITSIDTARKKISGSFRFKVLRPMDNLKRNITEGVFTNISYTTSLAPTPTTDTFHVKINGTLYTPPVVVGVSTPAIPPMTATIAINGTDQAASKTVGLIMPKDIVPGSYTLDLFGATYIGVYNPDQDPNHSQGATSGTLTILSHNTTTKRIRGNFNFHAEAILNPLLNSEMTEGYFSVVYQ